MVEVGSGAHGLACRPHDKFFRLEIASVLLQIFAQPVVSRAEPPLCYFNRNLRVYFDSGSLELRSENIADRPALNGVTDGTAKPMHVL